MRIGKLILNKGDMSKDDVLIGGNIITSISPIIIRIT